jgi:hypothetical protein
LFPIDGILSTPPNTLVIHLLDWGCGWREEEERWYCKQRKKERKFHDLLLLLNPKSPNNKFRFSLKAPGSLLFYGCPETRRERKIQNPISHKTTQFLPHPNKIKNCSEGGTLHGHTIPVKEIISSSAKMNSMSKDLRD